MPACDNLKVGDVVVSMPVAFDADGLHPLGFSNLYNGGYAELMVLNEMLGIKVPDGLRADIAAMTEPLAVGVHAVAKSRITTDESAIVLGCGPVGLACIAELKMPRHRADRRRRLLRQAPRPRRADWAPTSSSTRARRRRSRRGAAVDGVRTPVIFEAVGVPGMIDQAMRMAPEGRPHPRRRRLHAGGPDPPDARHRPGAQPPVRVRLRPRRVRRAR